MYGIKFIFHPNLNRILTDYGFKGYPLRKDFPLTGYLNIIYFNSLQFLKFQPIEFLQNLRKFFFVNS